MFHPIFSLPLCAVAALGALAARASAAPLEAPLKNQLAILSYEVELTGKLHGQSVHDRVSVRTPVFAAESGPLNPLGDGFTESQNAEFQAMGAAAFAPGEREGDAEALAIEGSRLIEAMAGVCMPNEASMGCAEARARWQAHEQLVSNHGATVAAQQAQVRRRDEDDHRFLILMAGAQRAGVGPVPTVEATYDHGGRKGVMRFPDPALPGSENLPVGNIVVLDRRDGSVALSIMVGLVHNGLHVVDVEPLVGAPGVRRVGLPFSSSVDLGLQPTAGSAGDYAGAKTIEVKGLRYQLRWRLERD